MVYRGLGTTVFGIPIRLASCRVLHNHFDREIKSGEREDQGGVSYRSIPKTLRFSPGPHKKAQTCGNLDPANTSDMHTESKL